MSDEITTASKAMPERWDDSPCVLCGKPLKEHFGLDPTCMPYISPWLAAHKRCAICGFVIDSKYEATKPTIHYGSAGRSKIAGDVTTRQLLDLLLSRIDFDGMDENTFTVSELRRAI